MQKCFQITIFSSTRITLLSLLINKETYAIETTSYSTDESEIEYIPISSTLTKIRIHKKTPNLHEVICFPITRIQPDEETNLKAIAKSSYKIEIPSLVMDYPPAPPRRISSKNSRTLKLVSSNPRFSHFPERSLSKHSHTNKNEIIHELNNKLSRQNTQIIKKEDEKCRIPKCVNLRIASTSAPPAINRKVSSLAKAAPRNTPNTKNTSSFATSRKTLLPTDYSNSIHTYYGEHSKSVVIEKGVGRRTPISNILDKVTSLDKLWSAEKRNEQIDLTKANSSVHRSCNNLANKNLILKAGVYAKSSPTNITHKSRDMIRTSEKVQKMKMSNMHTKSNPCLTARNDQKTTKTVRLQPTLQLSKSSSNALSSNIKQNNVKTAVVSNIKKKKSLENLIPKPRITTPCHESCSKKSRDMVKSIKKSTKSKCSKKTCKTSELDLQNQFGDTLKEEASFGLLDKYQEEEITEEIKKYRETVMSDSFFQHLFLGKSYNHFATYPIYEQNTTVLEKAKLFQSQPQVIPTPKLLNTYLIHKKPVSLSRFKMWDRYPSQNQLYSPRSVSWPGRISNNIQKNDRLSKEDQYGSTSSLASIRSKSEPPYNKIYFSQTSRPKSPLILFYNKEINPQTSTLLLASQNSQKIVTPTRMISPDKSCSIIKKETLTPTKIIFTETTRPVSPIVSQVQNKVSEDSSPTAISYSEKSRPTSPKVYRTVGTVNKLNKSNSISPIPTRSPSYRRIHSARQLSGKHNENTSKCLIRTRSAGDADSKLAIRDNLALKTKSDTNLRSNDPDYEEYIRDIQNTKARSERFKELNRYYTYLERVAELEKTTSKHDLHHRRKDEEIVDFDRWKKIRAIERAEEELNNLYYKLKIAQNENDVLFYPRDLKDFRWNYDKERGLKVKEKSVEDLKEHFQQMHSYDSLELEESPTKDIYKPLWRGKSVAETAYHINKRNEICENQSRRLSKPILTLKNKTNVCDLQKKIGLGNRLWSSLSLDQVNALKHQLNAIYSKDLHSKTNEKKEYDSYTVTVNDNTKTLNPSLLVRCNSLVAANFNSQEEKLVKLCKSESIAAMSCPISSIKELKNNVNNIQMSLSENEKRKISQTLSKELLNRMNKNEIEKQQPEDSAPKEIQRQEENSSHTSYQFAQMSHERPTCIVNISNDKKHFVVSPNEKNDIQYNSSTSETETASSDVSNKTVIFRGPSKQVMKKVEYFESVKNITDNAKSIYHARENLFENEDKYLQKKNMSVSSGISNEAKGQINQLTHAQSCTNIKELFGESEKNKFLSLPLNPELPSRSMSPYSEHDITDRLTSDTLRFSSDETIWRSRSPSPDPERYWRAYSNLARSGEVRKLVRRFDSPSSVGTLLRRHRSDPEIARNVLNKNWSFLEKLSPRKDKAMLTVARVPLRTTNRFMPHIDIISKLAALRRRTAPRSRSAEEALECRSGEVSRIRQRFEAITLLGHVYTSAPDVSELQDIAPYLTGPWVAHQYPKPSDNNRSIKDPSSLVRGRSSPVRKDVKLSSPQESVKLSSILKIDSIGKQDFDPTIHRPISRYEPPRAPPRPPPASWPQRLSPYVTSRHTVTFQETNSVPEPPRRALHGSYTDTESPRRYVESDVNIHYRCPVRHDPLPLVPERELALQQAEHMKRLYREQRRNKYLQELQDMQNRRHQDNFTPSQKTVVPLNRYDEADKVIAKALYTFNGQTQRELSFRKGEIIHVRRQIDANWYEGEVHGKVGLFPYNYVEIQKGDTIKGPKKSTVIEGRARAKFDFIAQTNLELPLKKGEVVVLTRRIDQNWWEGRNGVKTGIFPDSYVTVLQEPSQSKPEPKPILSTDKPVASPAAHGLLNGTDKRSMGSHSYMPQPNSPALANAPPATQPLPGYVAKPAQATLTPSDRGYGPPTGPGVDLNNAEPLYVDTNAEAVPYRAMYKYRPQNPDELELQEGDTVYVLEKCDDGWYVGSSQRTGRFGTFPGNYVERI